MNWFAKKVVDGEGKSKKQKSLTDHLCSALKLIRHLIEKLLRKLPKFDTILGIIVIFAVLFVVGNTAYHILYKNTNVQRILIKLKNSHLANLFTPKEIVPSNYKKIEIFNNDIKKAIDEHEVISFDIFDTLLIRPYVKPTDLFKHLELLNNAPGFAKARMKAEQSARRDAQDRKEDVTLDEIYQQIDSKYKPIKEKEMSLEYMVLRSRPEIKKIYDYARQRNKKIVIISDMYLSRKFLTDVLKKCEYSNFNEVFVSSEYGKTKASGSLYQHVIKNLGVSSERILHIGDNFESDIKKARQLGIDAFFVPKTLDCLFETDLRIRKFYENYKKDLGASIMLGLLSAHSERSYRDYWFDFGYKYAGPVIFGYMQWLDFQLNKEDIHKALFVARDGYTLEKVFNLIKTSDVQTYYIYLSRKISDKLLYGDQRQIGKARKEYSAYLNQFDLRDQKLAMIDSESSTLRAQNALIDVLPKYQVSGYYWGVVGKDIPQIKSKIFSFQKEHVLRINNAVLELFMTAPTLPIDDVQNGQPVFKETNTHEQERIKIYPRLSSGAVAFAQDYIQCFDKLSGYFSPDMLIDWVNIFFSMPTETDKAIFYRILNAEDSDHKKYRPIYPDWYH
ncbi:MAG: HAD-IA family hydrolase [Alphaproteobacteria bacterium]|nr:HAD-IA family hydrolase [Alphaproteobacteria bacterium]